MQGLCFEVSAQNSLEAGIESQWKQPHFTWLSLTCLGPWVTLKPLIKKHPAVTASTESRVPGEGRGLQGQRHA